MSHFTRLYDPNLYCSIRDTCREETLRRARLMGIELSAETRVVLEGKFTVVDQKALPPPKPCTGVLPE